MGWPSPPVNRPAAVEAFRRKLRALKRQGGRGHLQQPGSAHGASASAPRQGLRRGLRRARRQEAATRAAAPVPVICRPLQRLTPYEARSHTGLGKLPEVSGTHWTCPVKADGRLRRQVAPCRASHVELQIDIQLFAIPPPWHGSSADRRSWPDSWKPRRSALRHSSWSGVADADRGAQPPIRPLQRLQRAGTGQEHHSGATAEGSSRGRWPASSRLRGPSTRTGATQSKATAEQFAQARCCCALTRSHGWARRTRPFWQRSRTCGIGHFRSPRADSRQRRRHRHPLQWLFLGHRRRRCAPAAIQATALPLLTTSRHGFARVGRGAEQTGPAPAFQRHVHP